MSAVTTHVLDTAEGRPAEDIAVRLEIREGAGFREVGHGVTDADGRLRTLLPAGAPAAAGTYRISFATEPYFARRKTPCFFPEVSIVFAVADGGHYHVPLLLSPFGYSTYRGS